MGHSLCRQTLGEAKLCMQDARYLTSSVQGHADNILIVRLDAAGDYMLFRQSLRAISHAPAFANKRITLCGNAQWQPLAEVLDGDCFAEFLPISRALLSNTVYRHGIYKTLQQQNFGIALQPTFSREYWGDAIMRASSAPVRIGFASTALNISPLIKRVTDTWYTQLMPAKACFPWEGYRNHEFLQYLGITAQEIPPFQHNIPQELRTMQGQRVRDYAGHPVLFLGATEQARRWPVKSWVALIPLLYEKYGKPCILTGGADCVLDAQQIIQCITQNLPQAGTGMCVNLVGQTSLVELAILIADASVLISNDSVAAHMGATFSTPTVILWNGQHTGRFHPYPPEIAPQVRTLYPWPEPINDALIAQYYYAPSPLAMASISVAQVMEATMSLSIANS